MKKLTACLSAALLLCLLAGPAVLPASAAPARDPVLSPTEPDRPGPKLPDPNDPDSPDEIIIEEDGVPKTYIKVWDPETEEYVYILDEEPPLADRTAPQTGVTGLDGTAVLALTAAALGAGGMAALAKGRRSVR